MLTVEDFGLFTYGWGNVFHIQTDKGCFEWKDPEYPFGDNTIRPCNEYKQWCKDKNIPYGRDKGHHKILDYCGPNVVITQHT